MGESRVIHDHLSPDPRKGCAACDYPVGTGVVYRPHPDARAEDGEVVGVNAPAGLAFVLYVGDRHAKATRIEDLEHAR